VHVVAGDRAEARRAASPNHHRQLHYGGINVTITPGHFETALDGQAIRIVRMGARAN
jgi:hypothetical protein